MKATEVIAKIQDRHLFIALGAMLVLALLSYGSEFLKNKNAEEQAPLTPEKVASVDTLIPKGMVLIPIEIVNQSQLQSLIGSYAVVDLYAVSEISGKTKLLATRVKLVRAPLNPDTFAVLLPTDQSQIVMSHSGRFSVLIQNQNERGTQMVNENSPRTKSQKTVLFGEEK